MGNDSCFCSKGYNGISCNTTGILIHGICKFIYSILLAIEIYECSNNICYNGGTCQLIAGDTICICKEEYGGINCGMC